MRITKVSLTSRYLATDFSIVNAANMSLKVFKPVVTIAISGKYAAKV